MFKRSGWVALLLVAALSVFTGTVQAQKSYSSLTNHRSRSRSRFFQAVANQNAIKKEILDNN